MSNRHQCEERNIFHNIKHSSVVYVRPCKERTREINSARNSFRWLKDCRVFTRNSRGKAFQQSAIRCRVTNVVTNVAHLLRPMVYSKVVELCRREFPTSQEMKPNFVFVTLSFHDSEVLFRIKTFQVLFILVLKNIHFSDSSGSSKPTLDNHYAFGCFESHQS
jgi:hypothetical protein